MKWGGCDLVVNWTNVWLKGLLVPI